MDLKLKAKKLSKYAIVASFLAMEIFAFLSFSFSTNYLVFGILSFALLLITLIFAADKVSIDGLLNIAYLLFPLSVFTLLTALGNYSRFHITYGDFSNAEIVFIPLGIISIAGAGYVLSLNKTFSLKTFLIVLFGALAALVAINVIINIVNFGLFYTIKYKGYYMYYGGVKSSVSVDKMAYALEGFKFIEVDIEHYVMYPLLLLSSSFMLFFTSPREEKKTFWTYVAFTALGIISILIFPTVFGILGIVGVSVVLFVILLYKKKEKARKPLKIALYVILGAIGLVLLIMIVNNQTPLASIHNAIASNSLLNKIFNTNAYAKLYNRNLTDILCSDRFLGFYAHKVTETIYDLAPLTGSFIFDNFMTSGVLGSIAFIVMIYFGLKEFTKTKNESDAKDGSYGTILVYVLVYLLFSLMFNKGSYAIYYNVTKPFYMQSPFLISVFMMAYIMSTNKNSIEPEVKQDEVQA